MNWYQKWNALSARIQGLIDTGSLFYGHLTTHNNDSASLGKKVILPSAKKIIDDLKIFKEGFDVSLPKDANKCLGELLENAKSVNYDIASHNSYIEVQKVLILLAAFRSEFEYIIADTQANAVRITERAFVHLQRSIVADEEFRKKWQSKFTESEVQLEKLGAVHLLLHGVWAFKADAEKGRTDLIMNEPNETLLEKAEKTSNALVLTEWKKVTSQDELKGKLEEARKQAEIYSSNILHGIELTKYRYLVMVSEKSMKMPKDLEENGIIYRKINIAVDPATPSKEAKKK